MGTTDPRTRHRLATAFVGAALLVISGCSESPTDLDFEVIEEVEFAASLNIDLSTMVRRNTGVYFKDLGTGTGDEVVFGLTVTMTFTGWLADGTEFQTGQEFFTMGNSQIMSGMEDGLLNTRVGGTRLIIIPPHRAYGGQGLTDRQGNQIVPSGAVVIFEVTVDAVTG